MAARPLRGMQGNHSRLYVIECETLPLVKIGRSLVPEQRLEDLSAASPVPLRLIWTCEGDRFEEMRLHREFAEYRVHHEWFRREGRLAAWLDHVVSDAA